MGLSDGFVSQGASEGVDAAEESRLTLASFGQAGISQQFNIAVGHISQSLSGGSRVRSRHVGDAVMGDPFLDKNRVVVRGRARRFGAPSLVDSDVNQHTAWTHSAQHVAADQLRRARARQEDGSD